MAQVTSGLLSRLKFGIQSEDTVCHVGHKVTKSTLRVPSGLSMVRFGVQPERRRPVSKARFRKQCGTFCRERNAA